MQLSAFPSFYSINLSLSLQLHQDRPVSVRFISFGGMCHRENTGSAHWFTSSRLFFVNVPGSRVYKCYYWKYDFKLKSEINYFYFIKSVLFINRLRSWYLDRSNRHVAFISKVNNYHLIFSQFPIKSPSIFVLGFNVNDNTPILH